MEVVSGMGSLDTHTAEDISLYTKGATPSVKAPLPLVSVAGEREGMQLHRTKAEVSVENNYCSQDRHVAVVVTP